MTFQEIYTEILAARFKSSQTAAIKRWVNLREAQIWAAAEWPWKIVGPTALTITAADNTPTLPTDLFTPLAVYDDLGNSLSYSTQREFDDLYLQQSIDNVQNRPSAFKWNNGVLTLSAVPDASYSFQISYLRTQSHFATGGAVTSGPMVADSDYPLFDSSWHEILVLGGMSTGLKIENDPTWESLESEFGLMLNSMGDYYLPAVSVAGNMQYGADTI